MPNLDFFGARDDLSSVLEYLFSIEELHVYEFYSSYGEKIKQFHSVTELEQHYQLGIENHGTGRRILLQLWSPVVMAEPKIRRIDLPPESCNGHTFRECLEGSGLIQLYLGGVYRQQSVIKSHFGHNSEKRAVRNGIEHGVDWEALAQLSRKIQYHIRSKLAVARVPGRPILPQAYALAKQGYELKEFADSPWRYDIAQPPSTRLDQGVYLPSANIPQLDTSLENQS